MDSDTALNTLKDNLIATITDPYTQAGGSTRVQWIYYNTPISSPKYPIIEIKKVDNPEEVISIGPNFFISEFVFANLWVYSKNGFKVTTGGTTYLNSRLVEHVLVQIKETIKDQFSTLFSSGIIVRTINTTSIEYDPDTQLYYAACSVKVWFFRQ